MVLSAWLGEILVLFWKNKGFSTPTYHTGGECLYQTNATSQTLSKNNQTSTR